MPIAAAKIAVAAPIVATTPKVVGESANNALDLATRKIPLVTIVAAWISADTGVGPAIASGNQVYNGICALLPVHPRKSIKVIIVTTVDPTAIVPTTPG